MTTTTALIDKFDTVAGSVYELAVMDGEGCDCGDCGPNVRYLIRRLAESSRPSPNDGLWQPVAGVTALMVGTRFAVTTYDGERLSTTVVKSVGEPDIRQVTLDGA